MNKFLVGGLALVTVFLGACSADLSYSQRYAVVGEGYVLATDTLTANLDRLSDREQRQADVLVTAGKQYLDGTYDLLTDADPTNDGSVEPLLDALEDSILPGLATLEKETD